jgi:hypothetical protein
LGICDAVKEHQRTQSLRLFVFEAERGQQRNPAPEGVPHHRQVHQAELLDEAVDQCGLVREGVLGIGRLWGGAKALQVDQDQLAVLR